jgi:hypothetical protein
MITYPLALPDHVGAAKITLISKSINAMSVSPFTGSVQVQEYDGQWFEVDFTLPPMQSQQDAALWTAFLLKLNGVVGTFLMGDPAYVQQGNCLTAQVDGAVAARSKELPLKNMTVGSTIIAGDYIQLGTGLTSRLHKNLNTVIADGSDEAVLDIWPATRIAYSDSDPVVTVNPVGLFRLASNEMGYDVGQKLIYSGMSFGAREAI